MPAPRFGCADAYWPVALLAAKAIWRWLMPHFPHAELRMTGMSTENEATPEP